MADSRSSDTDEKRQNNSAISGLSVGIQRAAAAQLRRGSSDQNFQKPPIQYGSNGKRLFEYAPTPLKRLFGSPLVMAGKYARGPSRERLCTGGWGDPRNFSYEPGSTASARHQGLDFAAPKDEGLYACADGKVVFAGFQKQKGRTDVRLAHVDDNGNVRNSDEEIVATPDLLGFGGVCLWIAHDGDFEGYRTEYYHMQRILVENGTRVTEGQLIGTVGKSGVRSANIGTHLHFQIAFIQGKTSAFVNPTTLVPNFRPGGSDSTNTEGSQGLILPPTASVALQAAASQTANTLNALGRGTSVENRTLKDLKQGQASFTQRVAQMFGVQNAALTGTEAATSAKAPVVSGSMSFNFTTGEWLVNGTDTGPV